MEDSHPSAGGASSREHSAHHWEGYRQQITRLYSQEDRPLQEVMEVMENQYGFKATSRQYKTKISSWKLDKNIKPSEYQFMAQIQAKRAREEKETNFHVRGREVDPDKITRAVKRKKMSREELLAMPVAETPPDISYTTPSGGETLFASPENDHEKDPNHMPEQSPSNTLIQFSFNPGYPTTGYNHANFLLSPGYIPTTPQPLGWYEADRTAEFYSIQSPPGMLQSLEYFSNLGFDDEMPATNDTSTDQDLSKLYKLKHERLILLLRQTEEGLGVDYMSIMLEFNSLVYDLITYDQELNENIVSRPPGHSPKCSVCRALDEIQTETMAAKVESERLLLEAIAISEGRFGEAHDITCHFRLKLAFLYKGWSCRRHGELPYLLVRIACLAPLQSPSMKGVDILEEMINSDQPTISMDCPLPQRRNQARASHFSASSRQLPTPTIAVDSQKQSPRELWGIIKIFSTLRISRDIEPFGPILESILRLGPESMDGSLYFWMATFVAAVEGMWDLLMETQDNSNPKKVTNTRDMKYHAELFKMRTLPELSELPELQILLIDLSLSKLEGSDQSTELGAHFMPPDVIFDALCSAASLSKYKLIKRLGTYFRTSKFHRDSTSFTDILNLRGEWANEVGFEDHVPLHIAIKAACPLTVQALLELGAEPQFPKFYDETPVELARNNQEILNMLVKAGATIHPDELRGVIHLLDDQSYDLVAGKICSTGDLFLLLILIIKIGDGKRYELLEPVLKRIEKLVRSVTIMNMNSGILKSRYLLDEWEMSELDKELAEFDDSGRGLELVLDALTGVRVEQQARDILKNAFFASDTDLYKVLKPDDPSIADSPVLHTLVRLDAAQALGVFLEIGPDLQVTDTQENTALHLAAKLNLLACCEQVLKYDMDLEIKNSEGETAL